MNNKIVIFLASLLIQACVIYPEAKYFFHQQVNDLCMMAPMMNLDLLERSQDLDGNYNLYSSAYYSRREWMALNFPFLIAWHGAFEKLNTIEGKLNYPNLTAFVEMAVGYGPIFPHFYDKQGKILLSDNIREALAETFAMPYFLIDFYAVKHLQFKLFGLALFSGEDFSPGLGLFVPIIQRNNSPDYEVATITGQFPNQKVVFEPIDQTDVTIINPNNVDLSGLTAPKYFGMNRLHDVFESNVDFLGIKKAMRTIGLARGYLTGGIQNLAEIEKQYQYDDFLKIKFGVPVEEGGPGEKEVDVTIKKTHSTYDSALVTYSLGLYKLILLALGITDTPKSFFDGVANEAEAEQLVAREDTLGRIYQNAVTDLQQLMRENSNNPWHPSRLSKDKFLQHAIVQILKADPELYEEAKVVNDFYFRLWDTYNRYLNMMAEGDCFGRGKNRYYASLVKFFVPSEEYALAYGLTQNAWLLCLGGINTAAYYKALTSSANPSRALLLGALWTSFKKAAYEEQIMPGTDKRISYMDVWQKIKARLNDRYERKNWISFSGHGVVFSFDDKIIARQNRLPNENPDLLYDLGFTVIESWLGSELNTFYKKP